MSEAAQREVVEFLSRPEAYGDAGGRVEVIRTHASLVFLHGDSASKLKRAVSYSYLDYSTPERRRAACEAELEINRRIAPTLYRSVRVVTRMANGGLRLDGDGEAVDWLVEMRRFPDDALFDRMAERGQLTPPLIAALTDVVVGFHRDAPPATGYGGTAALAELIDGNLTNLGRHAALGLSPDAAASLAAALHQALDRAAATIDRRRSAGRVRQCHGDLHLGNICLLDGKPTLFDAIEFSPAIANIDVLYDLAFLLMDLLHRGLAEFAAAVCNRYLDLTGEDDGLLALPLFLALRALIRAHVRADAGRPEEGRGYLDLGQRLLQPAPRMVLAVGGPSGSGKSMLAAGLAAGLGAAPGARVLRSDVLRKRLHGAPLGERLPAAAYTEAASKVVFERLYAAAKDALAAGYAVVCDSVAMKPEQRAAFVGVARAAGVPFLGFWLQAPREVLAARIAGRRDDVSDATLAVLDDQLARDPGPLDWAPIDASGPPAATLAAARHWLAALTPR